LIIDLSTLDAIDLGVKRGCCNTRSRRILQVIWEFFYRWEVHLELSPSVEWHETSSPDNMNTLLTFVDPVAGIDEAAARRQDVKLVRAISDFLQGDVPNHFQADRPALYMSRVLATPSIEIERVAEFAEANGIELVVGEDLQAKFVSINRAKKVLLRPSFIDNEVAVDLAPTKKKEVARIELAKIYDNEGRPFN
jgi:hypothetical protein